MDEHNFEITPDTSDDGDSAIASVNNTSLTSLRSSILQFQEENGRTYHALSAGKYYLPNDEGELDRLDLQHNLYQLTLDNRLALCPKEETAMRVLDIGTGTGIWAIDYADSHPEAEVIGVDLSPVQPSFIPPNCSFEIDDVEKEWTWNKKFDFIFCRNLCGAFENFDYVIKQAYDNLEPGGYLEIGDVTFPCQSDDNSLPPDSALGRLSAHTIAAARNLGRPIDLAQQYKGMLEIAGFVDVVIQGFKWPTNQWPKDKKYKMLGLWALANIGGGIEGLTMALFTRGLGWSRKEVLAFCAGVRKDMRNTSYHAYFPLYICYGRKPK